MGISHSPPEEFFREFNKGITEKEILSPQFRSAGTPVTVSTFDQLPFHILIRNIQAEIAKCCRWSEADGSPSQFYLAQIVNGPDTVRLTDSDGNPFFLSGLHVTNPAFPQDKTTDTIDGGGSFFPVGVAVVAGWADAPSFYLEPRTGLVKNGEGIIFRSSSDSSTVSSQAKSVASGVPGTTNAAISAINYCGLQAQGILDAETDFFNNINQSNAPQSQKDAAAARVQEATDAVNAITAAQTAALALASSANANAQLVVDASETEALNEAAEDCASDLDGLADQVDIANQNCGGQPAADTAAAQSRRVRGQAQSLRFAGQGGSTKCELAFSEGNPAAVWNSPEDGSVPCNGMRSDCDFYTGPAWQYATTEKTEVGQKITAEAVQEVRYYSDDWSRYSNPEEEFRNRFTVPFIWTFEDFIEAGGTPEIEDMILYRPKVMFAREKTNPDAPDDNPNTSPNAYETMLIGKVEIVDFQDLEFKKAISRITPGQEVLDLDRVPDYASLVDEFTVPTATRLRISHPPPDETFIYRSWSPEFTNRISLFGTASPSQTIYIVNNTALQNRDRYHDFLNSKNIFDIPSGLPGANSDFNGILAAELFSIFDQLEREKESNQSLAVLGFDLVESDKTGFWESRVEVDLVHNAVNEIFVFILLDNVQLIFDKVRVDCRVLHSIVGQDTFTGRDFTINDRGGESQLGSAIGNIQKTGLLTATAHQVLGSEPVSLSYGYYGWRFKDRGLRFSNLNAGSDLDPGNTTSADDTSFVTETDASNFIVNVSYRVVQYRNTETIDNWYLLHDCGIIMAEIKDPEVNRVLPLPDQSGEVKALSPVLVNNGATGSVVAQWAPEVVTLNIAGETKNMVLLYRNEEGVGLPAQYAIYGPAPGVENLFGRPDPDRDTLTIQYTYLRAQTHRRMGEPATDPEGLGEVIDDNFYDDTLRQHNHSILFTETGLIAGGERPDTIGFDQQDYVFVFADATGRPIGRKYVRFMVAYYNLACVNVEIFYAWRSQCTTYGLFPDLFLATGGSNGTAEVAPKATINPDELTLGNRVSNLLGNEECNQIPNCGDHEILRLGPLRKEFETVIEQTDGEGDEAVTFQKAVYPSAGQFPGGFYQAEDIVYSEPPGTQWQRKRGALWYPYTVCEKPRYFKNMVGPSNTDTTELINETLSEAGVQSGAFGEGTFTPGAGVQGGLAPTEDETHHAYDQVVARLLDIHPTLRACYSGYTYGNTVLVGGAIFAGYARRRGEIDKFWYEGLSWTPPPFGNFGRAVLMCEVATKIGDYTPKAETIGFRWMPMFPEREDMGATIGLFGEDLESVVYRLVGTSCPLGGIAETIPDENSPRYTHRSMITNRAGGGIEYPYAPYFPTFLPNALIGLEPQDQGVAVGQSVPRGPITTGWAWREQDRSIQRGQEGTEVMQGLKFLLPDYFLDNRRMEVRLRPAEGNYQITYTAPEYDEDGEVVANAQLQLGDGPPREILIDFINRKFGPAVMADTVYDTSKILGEDPLDCEIQPSSNLQLAQECSCEGDSANLPEGEDLLPAVFIHGDSLSPVDYFVLYNSEEMEPAFPTDIPREGITQPCCMCNYFIEQVYFKLDSTFLPVTPQFDPAFSSAIITNYTWSRVPHGPGLGLGRDIAWAGQENLAQNYLEKQGVLTVRPFEGQSDLDISLITAYFPSTDEAEAAKDAGSGIIVPGPLPAGDPKLLGGLPATGGISQGQPEPITLDFTFDTFTSIKKVTLYFLAGAGREVPTVTLKGIPPANRTGQPTLRSGRELGQTTLTASDTSVPGSSFYSAESIQAGEALFQVTIIPGYADLPFWDKFYQEFHLDFAQRGDGSMGIHAVELSVESLLPTASLTETVFLPERRYYTSSFTPVTQNPEVELTGMDSCTAYWRTTEIGKTEGGNRFRAYSWGPKVNNESGVGQGGGQPIISGDLGQLESLQGEEYGAARQLMVTPYTFSFTSFIPLDEQRWLDFLGGTQPSWQTSVSIDVSPVEQLSDQDDELVYGEVPARSVWHAPGHAWIHNFDEDYAACCDGCGQSQVITYDFAHLHDNLAIVETAGFWKDFEDGSFGIGSILPSVQGNPDVRIINENEFRDQNGNPIPASVLNASGFRKDQDGNLVLTGYTEDNE
jgi:hypothetical protein